MKKSSIFCKTILHILSLLLLFSLTGCKKEAQPLGQDADLNFAFDENGEYLGFQKTENISPEEAAENGYVVFKDGCFESGEELLDAFLSQAEQDKESQLRLYSLWQEDTEERSINYTDLFYRDGLYYAFKTGLPEGQKNTAAGYPYLLLLWETKDSVKKESSDTEHFFLVLSEKSDISYSDIIKDMLSGTYQERSYQQLFWGSRKS